MRLSQAFISLALALALMMLTGCSRMTSANLSPGSSADDPEYSVSSTAADSSRQTLTAVSAPDSNPAAAPAVEAILFAAGRSAYYLAEQFPSGQQDADAQFAWLFVYLLVNSQAGSDHAICQSSDGWLSISGNQLSRYFSLLDFVDADLIPDIPAEYTSVIIWDAGDLTCRFSRSIDDGLRLGRCGQVDGGTSGTAIFELNLLSADNQPLAAYRFSLRPSADSLAGWQLHQVSGMETEPQDLRYGVYDNRLFGYALTYPLIFDRIDENESGDGAVFLTDTLLQLAVWGQACPDAAAFQAAVAAVRQDSPDYQRFASSKDQYQLVCPGDEGTSLFKFGWYRQNQLVQFVFQYPAEEDVKYQEIFLEMIRQLRK